MRPEEYAAMLPPLGELFNRYGLDPEVSPDSASSSSLDCPGMAHSTLHHSRLSVHMQRACHS